MRASPPRYLVSTANQVEVVPVQKALHDFGTERERDPAVVLAPRCSVLVRIAPQEVTYKPCKVNKQTTEGRMFCLCKEALRVHDEERLRFRNRGVLDKASHKKRPKKKATKIYHTSIGHVRRTLDGANLVHGLKVRGETSMTAEDLLFYNSSNRKYVETVCECLPQLNAVSPLAFVV
jgi:hypothetical protein